MRYVCSIRNGQKGDDGQKGDAAHLLRLSVGDDFSDVLLGVTCASIGVLQPIVLPTIPIRRVYRE